MRQGDTEHKAFEVYGKNSSLDLEMHPLHLLYLAPETHQQLQTFKAGYAARKSLSTEVADFLRGEMERSIERGAEHELFSRSYDELREFILDL